MSGLPFLRLQGRGGRARLGTLPQLEDRAYPDLPLLPGRHPQTPQPPGSQPKARTQPQAQERFSLGSWFQPPRRNQIWGTARAPSHINKKEQNPKLLHSAQIFPAEQLLSLSLWGRLRKWKRESS